MKCRCQSTSTNEPKTKRNLLDNASNFLTSLLSGGSLGSMPIAEGAVSDLFDRPLFLSLYDWFIEVLLFLFYKFSCLDAQTERLILLAPIYSMIGFCTLGPVVRLIEVVSVCRNGKGR